jgi:hypothetical protein
MLEPFFFCKRHRNLELKNKLDLIPVENMSQAEFQSKTFLWTKQYMTQ